MATGNKVPERLINFRVYNDGNDLLGVANVDLPSIEAMSDTVSGAGIAGEVESPILGHFGSMTATFTWRTITPELAKLANQKAHALDLRGSQQVYDAALRLCRCACLCVRRQRASRSDRSKWALRPTAKASSR